MRNRARAAGVWVRSDPFHTLGVAVALLVLLAIAWWGISAVAGGDDGKTPVAAATQTPEADGKGDQAQPGDGKGDLGVPVPAAGCPTTAEAKTATQVDVQRIGTEHCAWVWRAVPRASTNALCPQGWLCTFHLATGDRIEVIEGARSREIVAGTFRMVAAYPATDAVHRSCELLGKEQQFGKQEVPSFPVVAGEGLNCSGLSSSSAPQSGGGCPSSVEAVASIVGGNSSNWRQLSGTEGKGWKYGPSSNARLTVPPSAVLDHPGGRATPGQAITAGEATLWCPA